MSTYKLLYLAYLIIVTGLLMIHPGLAVVAIGVFLAGYVLMTMR